MRGPDVTWTGITSCFAPGLPAIIRNLEQNMQRTRTARGLPGYIVVLIEDIHMSIAVGGHRRLPIISGREAQAGLGSKTTGCMNGDRRELKPYHTCNHQAGKHGKEIGRAHV